MTLTIHRIYLKGIDEHKSRTSARSQYQHQQIIARCELDLSLTTGSTDCQSRPIFLCLARHRQTGQILRLVSATHLHHPGNFSVSSVCTEPSLFKQQQQGLGITITTTISHLRCTDDTWCRLIIVVVAMSDLI